MRQGAQITSDIGSVTLAPPSSDAKTLERLNGKRAPFSRISALFRLVCAGKIRSVLLGLIVRAGHDAGKLVAKLFPQQVTESGGASRYLLAIECLNLLGLSTAADIA